jgi:hypothetical protein
MIYLKSMANKIEMGGTFKGVCTAYDMGNRLISHRLYRYAPDDILLRPSTTRVR